MTSVAPVSAAVPTADVAPAAGAPLEQTQIGRIGSFWRRDEPLFAGPAIPDVAPSGSFDDALASAAAVSISQGGGAMAVLADNSVAPILQPIWHQGRFGREDAFSTAPALLFPTKSKADGSKPTFEFRKLTVDRHGYESFDPRSGRISLDGPMGDAVKAVVGGDWAVVDGSIRAITPGAPPVDPTPPVDPPVDPTPPVDPNPPVDPTPRPPRTLLEDVTEAARLAASSQRIIEGIPADAAPDATKDVRIKAYKTNMAAQERIERQFGAAGVEPGIVSTLRTADAHLEDANWQLAKKASPDGRFTGVDVPGALADTQSAVELLEGLKSELVSAGSDAA